VKVIPKIVVTGGPCGGKTTGQTFLAKRFQEIGYYPFLIPEAATILLNGNITFRDGTLSPREFQGHVMDLICALEFQFECAAHQIRHPKPVIIADRGLMDGRAYASEQLFLDIMHERNLDLHGMRDLRYHGVFHLRTAALGVEEFYTLENNTARDESLEKARALDEATLQSWIGHPNHHVIENTVKSIEAKHQLLWEKVSHVFNHLTFD
jgi:hypothetical protein